MSNNVAKQPGQRCNCKFVTTRPLVPPFGSVSSISDHHGLRKERGTRRERAHRVGRGACGVEAAGFTSRSGRRPALSLTRAKCAGTLGSFSGKGYVVETDLSLPDVVAIDRVAGGTPTGAQDQIDPVGFDLLYRTA